MNLFKNLTTLTVFSIIWFLILIFFYTTEDGPSGYKIIAFLGASIFGFIGLFIDFILKKCIKNRMKVNIIGLLLVIIFTIWLTLNIY
jgi:hypothetical protein